MFQTTIYRNLKTTRNFSLNVSFRSTIPIIDNQFVFLPSLQKTGHGDLVVDWLHIGSEAAAAAPWLLVWEFLRQNS